MDCRRVATNYLPRHSPGESPQSRQNKHHHPRLLWYGTRFGSVYITDSGVIMQSPTWDTRAEGGLSMVFSFIVAMLETSLKSTPITTHAKPAML